jgi:HEPN superfamily AbiU2-like protein
MPWLCEIYACIRIQCGLAEAKRSPAIAQVIEKFGTPWWTILELVRFRFGAISSRFLPKSPEAPRGARVIKFATAQAVRNRSGGMCRNPRYERRWPNANKSIAAAPLPWLSDYLRSVYEPTATDFRRLRSHIKKYERVYDSKYRQLRNRFYAHKEAARTPRGSWGFVCRGKRQ